MKTQNEVDKILQKKEKYIIGGILVFAFVLRTYQMGKYSLWGDEVDSIYAGIHQIYYHPPLFGFLAAFWAKFAATEYTLRLMATFFSLAALYTTWILAKIVLNSFYGAFWSALFMLFSPSQVYYAREFRMYSLLTFLAAISWISFIKWVEKGRFLHFFPAVLTGTLLIYTHNYGLIFLAAQGLSLLIVPPFGKSVKRLLSYSIAIFILYIPYLRHLIFFFNQYLGSKFWAESVGWHTPFYILRFLVSGLEAPHRQALVLITLGFGLFLIGMSRPPNRPFRQVVICGFFMPIVIAITLSVLLPSSTFVARYLIFISVPLYIGMAAGVQRLSKNSLFLVIPIVLFAGQCYSISLQYRNLFLGQALELRERKEFRESCQVILDRCKDGDIIGTTCMSGTHPVWYYITFKNGFPPSAMVDIHELHFNHINRKYNLNDYIKKKYPIALPVDIEKLLENGDYKRFWFYGTQWNEGSHPDDFYFNQRNRIREWLTRHYTEMGVWLFEGVDVRLFDLETPSIQSMLKSQAKSRLPFQLKKHGHLTMLDYALSVDHWDHRSSYSEPPKSDHLYSFYHLSVLLKGWNGPMPGVVDTLHTLGPPSSSEAPFLAIHTRKRAEFFGKYEKFCQF